MSRQPFRRYQALAVVAVLTAAAAAACSSAGHSTSTTSAPSTLTVAVNFMPTTADPDPNAPADAEFASVISTNLAGTLFSYLGTKQDPATTSPLPQPQPELATSAVYSAAAKTMTVHLRPNVYSSWGNPLTSADVVWTVQRALNTNLYGKAMLTQANVNLSDPVTAEGPDTVVFHLTSAAPAFEQALAVPLLTIFDEKAIKAQAGANDPWGRTWTQTHSATFGPYQVSQSALPNKIQFTANPHYWRGAPAISTFSMVLVSDDSTRLATVLSGSANYGVALDPQDLAKIKSSSSVTAYIQPNTLLMYYLVYNLKNPQVSNVSLRRALSAVINRQDLVTTAFNGAASPVTGCLPTRLYPGQPSSPYATTATGDVAKAKQLLQSAPGSHAVTIGYVTATSTTAMAQLIQADFASIGVTTTLKPYASYTTFFADQAKAKFGIGIDGFGPFLPTPAYTFSNLLSSSSGQNEGGYDNPTMDSAIKAAQTTTGTSQANGNAEACRLMLNDAPIAMLTSVSTVSAVSKSLTNLSSTGQIPLVDSIGNG